MSAPVRIDGDTTCIVILKFCEYSQKPIDRDGQSVSGPIQASTPEQPKDSPLSAAFCMASNQHGHEQAPINTLTTHTL
jgi:hypothetical protein